MIFYFSISFSKIMTFWYFFISAGCVFLLGCMEENFLSVMIHFQKCLLFHFAYVVNCGKVRSLIVLRMKTYFYSTYYLGLKLLNLDKFFNMNLIEMLLVGSQLDYSVFVIRCSIIWLNLFDAQIIIFSLPYIFCSLIFDFELRCSCVGLFHQLNIYAYFSNH